MIRLATVDDRVRVIEMATRFILEGDYRLVFVAWSPERVAAFVDAVLERGVIFVAEDYKRYSVGETFGQEVCISNDKELVGMLAMMVVEHPLTGWRFADELAWWVEPEHRQGSVGPRLLRHMEHWCAEQALHMVKMVAPAGSSVEGFYKNHGYQALETHWIKVLTDGSDDKPRDRSGARRRPTGG